jgi:hypothetical protein
VTPARRWLSAAALAGGVHAAFSLYWALGGGWLLDTVGQWAVRLASESPARTATVLGLVALVKASGAVLPLAWAAGRLRPDVLWRRLFLAGAVVLVCYGALNVTVSWAVLSGALPTSGGVDRRAQLGHAALWDPLFLVWGLCLLIGVRSHSRASGRLSAAATGTDEP